MHWGAAMLRTGIPVAITAVLLTLGACADSPAIELATGAGAPGIAEHAAGLARCTGRPFTPPARINFRHLGSALVALSGARHRAQDVLVPPGDQTELVGKLTYGPTWKDLEDERVRVFVDTCDRWADLGDVITDDDGVARVAVDVQLAPGQYEVRYVVRGDQTQAVASLWVLPAGTHLAVTDIDGTLTTSDGELFRQLLDGSYVPTAYPSAAALTRTHADRGHVVVYLTGRPSWLLDVTRGWLTGGGFATGPVHTADSMLQVLPVDGSVGAYKEAWLEGLEDLGYTIDLAYGNATTDIYAYTGAGVPPSEQWIIGANAGASGTNPVAGSWATRTAEVAASPPVAQPF